MNRSPEGAEGGADSTAERSGAEGYRAFDHTGDLGLEVWAPTPERLFALAAEVVSAQAVESHSGPAVVRRVLSLEGDGPEDLLVHWLNTSLLESELGHAVWTRIRVTALTSRRLEAELEGQPLDRSRQVFLREIKAVSHHHLDLDLAGTPCRCRLVLDL
ncbi:MAG TPA: archease [Candidatus Eisenbacteria bacterium]|jgi:SHS2 domain-containing protein